MVKEENKFILGFSLINNFGPASFKKIDRFFSSLENAWQCDKTNFFIKAGLAPKIVEVIMEEKKKINLEKEWETMLKQEIGIISIKEKDYSRQLKNIPAAPFAVFYKGNKELLNKKQLAVVGSRKPSFYGRQAVEKIIPDLIRSGLAITSGLAMGIDSLAHKIALNNQGETIAVLGSGLDKRNIPANSYGLFNQILDQNGLIISEYPPHYTANKFTFPARNRIISGLSLGVLVIEAGEKSGTLITADYALEQNREIFAIPGNIFSVQSIGTNQLIKNGAKLVSSANDIFEEINFIAPEILKNSRKDFTDEIEEKIYNFLTFEPMHIDKIAKKFSLSSAEVSQKISLMELKGLIKGVMGNKFVRN